MGEVNQRIRSIKQLYEFLLNEGSVNQNPVKNLYKIKTPTVTIQPLEGKRIKLCTPTK